MISHGVAPFLECSSLGDNRLSAFGAYLWRQDGKHSIEELYQRAKVFDTPLGQRTYLTPLCAKQMQRDGRRIVNMREVRELYAKLWDEYIGEHPELLSLIRRSSGLSDYYGQPGHACQATELWRIRNNGLSPEEGRAYWNSVDAREFIPLRLL